MQEFGIKSANGFEGLGIKPKSVKWNLGPAECTEEVLKNGEGVLTDRGSVMVDTGKFTGRAPKNRFVVEDDKTRDTVWWGNINQPATPETFDILQDRMVKYLEDKDIYVRDCYAGADPNYRLNVRIFNTIAWQHQFTYNMFIRPSKEELETFESNFTIICIPEFEIDDYEALGLNARNFALLNMTKRMLIIGGTGYAGEMKKGIFSVLNYILPEERDTLSMHCSANEGKDGDVAIFFGLSGTGKTTLSADPNRALIGDDEHGWTESTVFNFEGGCYAKSVDLTEEKEPEIWNAIKFGAIEENTRFFEGTRKIDYENTSVTENIRVSYPINHISNAKLPSIGNVPKNIFFLTFDASGTLPAISKLSKGQAMFHFISGYTSKVAGTEMGITEPVPTFSACFGAAFLPLHPTKYAEMLGKKMEENEVNVWMINTGLNGTGSRTKLKYTRAMITAALEGKLDNVEFEQHPEFGFQFPTDCPGVPSELLNPRDTWTDVNKYQDEVNKLADKFNANFEKFKEYANEEILGGAPKALQS
ncbi:phosphoenolpyruvate carboxykinase (ATP) [Aureibacter tunicatorum]|uniref:Phosphoenolpyruvate carboxykinase (ATP) n=1 Tax=Aureibacter tunicatorum TaxID=866807 RepID=A0AAE4BSY9_9BACT|nr:phosphoenolpyruvate carboxykinase (ATP) [Aureibacter tunicatorum]MDR6239410.1 phosphoenolpyruvate carboxykinase (ATP) [Aureibacter tunicatorum]BDD04667.1 phosphoenolpyruvate carboxykinase [ATP] 2 [Aureibacter tunicatorum]